MIPTGSRLLFGATALASVTAIIYASTVWGALGTTGLVFLAVALGVVAGINLFVRDSDVAADDPAGATESAAARRAPMPSIWPVIGALGGVLVVLGLITYPVVFVFGIVTLLAAVVEWMLEAWSERASASQQFNTDVRERLAHPAEFPVLAALLVGVVVYSFSRIMLFLSKTGGPIAFGVVAALVLAVGFLIAYRPQLKSSAVQAVAAIAILGLVAGGVVTAIAGERELHPHETTGTLAALGQCDTPDETHADEHASQTIGAKANLHGEVILRSDGTLVARSTGVAGESDVLTIARANATNVRFRNESGERRRLVLDLGEAPVDEAAAGAMVEPTIAEETPPGATVTPSTARPPASPAGSRSARRWSTTGAPRC
jgi:hypothetical protein